MRSLLYLLTALSVIALAAWAYRENHLTQQAMNERSALQREIVSLNEAIRIQRAEWAYLNRPDRLRSLVDVNFERLKLVPISGDHFGEIGQIAYPLPEHRSSVIEGIEVFGAIRYLTDEDEEDDTP